MKPRKANIKEGLSFTIKHESLDEIREAASLLYSLLEKVNVGSLLQEEMQALDLQLLKHYRFDRFRGARPPMGSAPSISLSSGFDPFKTSTAKGF